MLVYILGNVIALLDTSGAVVVEYTYDAWGNNVVSNANKVIITDAKINGINISGIGEILKDIVIGSGFGMSEWFTNLIKETILKKMIN